jgi:hypothetical protein
MILNEVWINLRVIIIIIEITPLHLVDLVNLIKDKILLFDTH